VRQFAVLTLLASALLTGACDSTDFRIDPLLYTDTVEIAVPTAENADLPSALDVTVYSGELRGGAFPERASQAGEWDFALRRREGGLAFVPGTVLGLRTQASLTRALEDETFESLIEAPGRTSLVRDSAVVLRQGAVYAARSRIFTTLFGTTCEQYAKFQPLAIDPSLGRVRLQITTNERCSDPRLALED
jgi:hypothetical protein